MGFFNKKGFYKNNLFLVILGSMLEIKISYWTQSKYGIKYFTSLCLFKFEYESIKKAFK